MSFFLLTVSATSETYTLSLHDALPISDVHEDTPLDEVASVVDVLQTPAFLCRQTNFIQNVARCGKPMNIKKGQFLSPWEMSQEVEKARADGDAQITECESSYVYGSHTHVTS